MWGPPDAVRFAVRANAERMGIDYTRIIMLTPFWEGAGAVLRDYGPLGLDATINGPTWSNGSLNFNDNNATASYQFADVPTTWCFRTYTHNPKQMWFLTGDSTSSVWGFGGWDTNGTARFYTGSTSSRFTTSAGVVQPSVNQDWSVVYDSTNISNVFLNGQSVTPASNVSGSNITGPTVIRIGGRLGEFWSGFSGIISMVFIAKLAMTLDQSRQFHHQPYALLMPVARPVYFDIPAAKQTEHYLLEVGKFGEEATVIYKVRDTSFTHDFALTPAETYRARLKHITQYGNSEWSDWVVATTSATPVAPTGLYGVATANSITWYWN